MAHNPYQILGVDPHASLNEIKSAYRQLVKKHHPDTGGDPEQILLLNSAWEILRDHESRQAFDITQKIDNDLSQKRHIRDLRNVKANHLAKSVQNTFAKEEGELSSWLKNVYAPINRLIGQVINPFQSKIRELSADPYDDLLMDSFCSYLEESKKKLIRIDHIYRSSKAPSSAKGLAINLYRCFSQVQDGLNELEKYTMGYVDNYLHDGNEMIREAKKNRLQMQQERKNLPKS